MTSSNLMEGLLTMLLSDKLGVDVKSGIERERNPEADRLRNQIRQSMSESREVSPQNPADALTAPATAQATPTNASATANPGATAIPGPASNPKPGPTTPSKPGPTYPAR